MASTWRLGPTAALLVAFVAGCGSDGSDQLAASDDVVELVVVSGGDVGDDDGHGEDAGRQEETGEAHDTTAEEGRDAGAAHDMTAEEGRDAGAAHDADAGEAHDTTAEESHDVDAGEAHDMTAEESHDVDAGEAHDADEASATGLIVNVEMVEFGYVADVTSVPIGEPVTFRFENTGVVEHEAMFGSMHEQEEFAEQGGHDDGHGSGHHGEIAAITVPAGGVGEIVVEFSSPGELVMGCHIPGHYEAGMVTSLTIA